MTPSPRDTFVAQTIGQLDAVRSSLRIICGAMRRGVLDPTTCAHYLQALRLAHDLERIGREADPFESFFNPQPPVGYV